MQKKYYWAEYFVRESEFLHIVFKIAMDISGNKNKLNILNLENSFSNT